jgi:hypothetical protein
LQVVAVELDATTIPVAQVVVVVDLHGLTMYL